jgi:nicotinamide riboside kinase
MEQCARVYIVGPSVSSVYSLATYSEPHTQSTGKTTLCNALAKRLGLHETQFVTEVARRVIKAVGLGRESIGMLEMQKAIMLAHLEREQENEDGNAQLCDRSAVDPIVYAIFTATDPADAESRKQALVSLPEFQRVLPRYQTSLFVLLTPVKEWLIDDGFRHVGDETKILTIFRDTLTELGIRYREIGSDMRFLPERTSFVLSLARAPYLTL